MVVSVLDETRKKGERVYEVDNVIAVGMMHHKIRLMLMEEDILLDPQSTTVTVYGFRNVKEEDSRDT